MFDLNLAFDIHFSENQIPCILLRHDEPSKSSVTGMRVPCILWRHATHLVGGVLYIDDAILKKCIWVSGDFREFMCANIH